MDPLISNPRDGLKAVPYEDAVLLAWLVGGVDGTRATRGESRATPEDVAPPANERQCVSWRGRRDSNPRPLP